MNNPLLTAPLARERYQELLKDAEQRRLVARARQNQLTLTRRAARPLGHALLRLGASLLRYGLVDQPASRRVYRTSVRSIKLN
jgi:hypothetical protein